MSDNTRDQSLAVLRWLIDAGADEAVSEAPVNRFAHSPPNTPLPSASAFAKAPADKSRTPLASKELGVTPSVAPAKTSSSAQTVSLSTAPGAARALAQSCTTLAELKTAVM